VSVVATTRRLTLRELTTADAPFIWELVGDPDFIRFIGDRGVRSVDDAGQYLERGPFDMYARHGFGLWGVELKATGTPIGMCGLLKRDWLDDVDIGYALLPAFRGQGYAFEAARAVLTHAMDTLGLPRVAAIVSPGNEKSEALLGRLGMTPRRMVRAPDTAKDLQLYAIGRGEV
jgi:ribosomal-protein-alanine N-acetyltransferase